MPPETEPSDDVMIDVIIDQLNDISYCLGFIGVSEDTTHHILQIKDGLYYSLCTKLNIPKYLVKVSTDSSVKVKILIDQKMNNMTYSYITINSTDDNRIYTQLCPTCDICMYEGIKIKEKLKHFGIDING